MAQFSNSDTSEDAACVRAIISHAMVIKNAVPITVPASKSRAARLRTALLKISARSTKAIIKRTAKRLKGARLSKIILLKIKLVALAAITAIKSSS